MKWKVIFLPEVEKDLRPLDKSQKILVYKALDKVSVNPLPAEEGGIIFILLFILILALIYILCII